MIDKIILGYLTVRDLTMYDIRKAMERSVSHFYSSSLGSINPAIKKLESGELVRCTETIENSRLKKVYSITESGKKAYNDWLSTPIEMGRLKEEALVRLYFMGDADPETRSQLLADFTHDLSQKEAELQSIIDEVNEREIAEEHQEKLRFQMLTVEFGVAYYQFALQWFHKLMNSL